MGFVEQFVALLQRDHDSTHEHLLAALLALTQGHPPSIEECRRSEFLFREFLDNRIELVKDRDECLVNFLNLCVNGLYNLVSIRFTGGSRILPYSIIGYFQRGYC